jgi:hypothetical protein
MSGMHSADVAFIQILRDTIDGDFATLAEMWRMAKSADDRHIGCWPRAKRLFIVPIADGMKVRALRRALV